MNQSTSLQQAGTLRFMGAVMDLGTGNVNGAAVGFAGAVSQYKAGTQLATASPTPAGPGSPAAPGATAAPAPLDTSFLHAGQGNAVGDQFEQKTGMSRDSVPPFVQGISSGEMGLHDFVKNVPNEEFRANMAAASTALPPDVKQVLAVGSEPMPEAEGYAVNLQGPAASPAVAAAVAPPGIPIFPTSQGQPPPGGIPTFPTSQGQAPPSAASADGPSRAAPVQPPPAPTLASLLPENFHGKVAPPPVAPAAHAPASRAIASKTKDHLDPLLDAFATGQESEPTIFQRVTQKYSELRYRLLRKHK